MLKDIDLPPDFWSTGVAEVVDERRANEETRTRENFILEVVMLKKKRDMRDESQVNIETHHEGEHLYTFGEHRNGWCETAESLRIVFSDIRKRLKRSATERCRLGNRSFESRSMGLGLLFSSILFLMKLEEVCCSAKYTHQCSYWSGR